MRREWRRRTLAYGVLVVVLAGTLYQLKNTAVKVDVSVDLIGARTHQGEPLSELSLEFFDDGGAWLSATVFRFPADLYVDGPPVATRTIELGLPRGRYEVGMTLRYGAPPGRLVARRVEMTVEQEGSIRLRAAP
jgi:hypothetical protein